MIWLFGGGFNGGTTGMDETDGRVLAALGDVVVVAVNYRNGVFGFVDFAAENVNGNQGLWDMVAAVEWMRDNGHAFGGDRDQVTLFANSAGAISVGLFMQSPRTRSLFARAVMQSGSPLLPNSFYNKAQRTTRSFLKNLNCKLPHLDQVLNCVRSKSTEELIDAQSRIPGSFPFGPKFDKELVVDYPADVYRQQRYDATGGPQQLLMGANADEGSIILHFTFPDIFTNTTIRLNVSTLTEMRDLTENKFAAALNIRHEHAVLLAELFFTNGSEVDTTANLVQRLQRVLGDLAFTCPVTSFGRQIASSGVRTFVYQFAHVSSGSAWAPWMGATHGDEYTFVFGHPLRYPERYSLEDVELSRKMVRVWSDFAKTGTPMARWPTYDAATQKYVVFDSDFFSESSVRTSLREAACAIFRKAIDND